MSDFIHFQPAEGAAHISSFSVPNIKMKFVLNAFYNQGKDKNPLPRGLVQVLQDP